MNWSGSIDKVGRREFLLGAGAVYGLGMSNQLLAGGDRVRVVIVPDEACGAAATAPVRWALGELARELEEQRVPVVIADATCHVEEAGFYVAVGARTSELKKGFGAVQAPAYPESLTLAPGTLWGKPAVLADGSDARGLTYAVLELAGRVRTYGLAALAVTETTLIVRQTRFAVCPALLSAR